MPEADAERPRLTVAMIVRNAATGVRESLESIRGIADEIVVLDTGSTDDTITVAKQCGATVHRRPWDDDFAAARNACLAKTSGDWILWLDAGERLTTESAARLREFIDAQADPQLAYLMPIVLPAATGQIGGEHLYQVRLHPLEEGVAFAGRVRETLDESLAAVGIGLQVLDIPIHRGPRDHDSAVKSDRAQRNVRLADLALATTGPAAAMHNCLGEALQVLGDPLRSAQQYQQALRLAAQPAGSMTAQPAGKTTAPQSRDLLEAYYGLLTCLDGTGPDRSAQLTLCMEALDRFPLDAQLLVALGGYLQSVGQLQLAVRSYDVAFRHGQMEARIWHLPEIREIAAVCAASLQIQLGADQDARTLLEAATRALPQSLRLARQLVELNLKLGRRDAALAALGAAPLAAAVRDAWTLAIRGVCLAREGQWLAARADLQSAFQGGCHERFCGRSLITAHLALNDTAGAAGSLESWRAVDPANPELIELSRTIADRTGGPISPPSTLANQAVRIDTKPGQTSSPTITPASAAPVRSSR
jgi:tetratricopeptide (TPR) repeat protein